MLKFDNKINYIVILFLSIVILLSAYFIEYILNYKACYLCVIERIPYIVAIFITSLMLLTKKYEKIALLFLSLNFLAGGIVSFYHFGIEQGFFSEAAVCNVSGDNVDLSKNSLLKELQNEQISCKDVDFTIMGMSLATINTIISFLLSIIIFKLFINYEKNK